MTDWRDNGDGTFTIWFIVQNVFNDAIGSASLTYNFVNNPTPSRIASDIASKVDDVVMSSYPSPSALSAAQQELTNN